MIFVTVGNMDPFDRLIQAIDQWIVDSSIEEKVIAQIGVGTYQPKNCEFVSFLTPTEYRETFREARIVVSHAGMGSIITALELLKPIIIMPKRAALGEQRNDHQLATVRRFRRSSQIMVADTEVELPEVLNRVLHANASEIGGIGKGEWSPDDSLIRFVREFVS
jgi:UDP-N-acetylglucosamine transferase subunit ALG13